MAKKSFPFLRGFFRAIDLRSVFKRHMTVIICYNANWYPLLYNMMLRTMFITTYATNTNFQDSSEKKNPDRRK